MPTNDRDYSSLDRVLFHFDQAVRTLGANYLTSDRDYPGKTAETESLTTQEKSHAAGLMRINHVGEICAQALYQGQAITARDETIRQNMQQAATEEFDHLAWCNQRLQELSSRPSYLNRFWYTASLSMGVLAGLAGDKWSLGFLAETERQVVKHLTHHLDELPSADTKSREIVAQMREDEAKHAEHAVNEGAAELPWPLKKLMTIMSKTMTLVAYRL